jgi:hypothetical protein
MLCWEVNYVHFLSLGQLNVYITLLYSRLYSHFNLPRLYMFSFFTVPFSWQRKVGSAFSCDCLVDSTSSSDCTFYSGLLVAEHCPMTSPVTYSVMFPVLCCTVYSCPFLRLYSVWCPLFVPVSYHILLCTVPVLRLCNFQ